MDTPATSTGREVRDGSSTIISANLGFPRVGKGRELKWSLERHWRGDLDAPGLLAVASNLRAAHWRLQHSRGIERIPSGDFSLYDHVLDTAVTLGAIPTRFGGPFDLANGDPDAVERYFAMARGRAGTPALELTKWFDTNYHYLVPELAPDQAFTYSSPTTRAQLQEAAALDITTRPVVLGPITFLQLSKRTDGGPTIALLDAILPAYEAWLTDLVEHGATAIQLDEPALVLDLSPAQDRGIRRAYERLRHAAGTAELTLATYFGAIGPNIPVATALPVDILHIDLVRAPDQVRNVVDAAPATLGLSLGVVDGRNVWRTDLAATLQRFGPLVDRLGARSVHFAPASSLLHLPVDLSSEVQMDNELRSWLAFATQRLEEIALLTRACNGDEVARGELTVSSAAIASRSTSPRVQRPAVQRRLATVVPDQTRRVSAYPERAEQQRARLRLPLLPTTTIGSFPQTTETRQLRAAYRNDEIDVQTYEAGLRAATQSCVHRQEALGLDVLVHGEFERTDMVEYFGEQLDGFATTSHGWVQSYGSRCVKPPVLYGDVARPHPMTVRWSTFAASLTEKPMKAMLTGPVTILQWSFVRDDQPRATTTRQLALALRDEVADLEAAGLPVIQIDEPALREGLPLRRGDWREYLDWATEAFRLTASCVRDDTQIHTHMCYAEFGEIMDAIIALDADVISMEASRSGSTLIEELRAARYPNEVGPGVWDIHSPRIPSSDEVDRLIGDAVAALDLQRLWVNPDCGLKTRSWPEVEASLSSITAAVQRARARVGGARRTGDTER